MNFEEENIKTSNIQSLILEPLKQHKRQLSSTSPCMNILIVKILWHTDIGILKRTLIST